MNTVGTFFIFYIRVVFCQYLIFCEYRITGKFCGGLFSAVFCGYKTSAKIKIANYSYLFTKWITNCDNYRWYLPVSASLYSQTWSICYKVLCRWQVLLIYSQYHFWVEQFLKFPLTIYVTRDIFSSIYTCIFHLFAVFHNEHFSFRPIIHTIKGRGTLLFLFSGTLWISRISRGFTSTLTICFRTAQQKTPVWGLLSTFLSHPVSWCRTFVSIVGLSLSFM